MIGTILLILCYVISYFLIYLRFRGVYVKESSDANFERRKLPLILLVVMIFLGMIPVFNLIVMIGYWILLIKYLDDEYYRRFEIRSILLKSI